MEKKIKIIVFVSFVGFMILSLFITIPTLINNIIYGTMAIIAIFFVITNREQMGLTDMFKKEDEELNDDEKI